MARRNSNDRDDSMTLVLVNAMRQVEEATERMRAVVKAIALRDGVQWELPGED